jgi:LmbE family N-acetylglucosaminyl deacetylase
MISEAHIVPYETQHLPVGDGPWLVFAPHADDESFGMGGTLAKASDAGIETELVIMTDGSLGGDQVDLVETRQEEAKAAAAILGINSTTFLNYSDRGLKVDNQTTGAVLNEIKRVRPRAVFFPGPFELHPDHRASAQLVWGALQQRKDLEVIPVSYEILVQSPVNTLVDISLQLEHKIKAMGVYKSQVNENRYESIALAMNELRSLTLPAEVSHAEGFYRFPLQSLERGFAESVVGKITSFF